MLRKENVFKRNQVEHTKTERAVLTKLSHPFIVSLKYAFQTPKKLYFVLEYCPGGELFFHLSRAGKFFENRCRFYASEICLAIQYLHQHDTFTLTRTNMRRWFTVFCKQLTGSSIDRKIIIPIPAKYISKQCPDDFIAASLTGGWSRNCADYIKKRVQDQRHRRIRALWTTEETRNHQSLERI